MYNISILVKISIGYDFKLSDTNQVLYTLHTLKRKLFKMTPIISPLLKTALNDLPSGMQYFDQNSSSEPSFGVTFNALLSGESYNCFILYSFLR